jgi:hypothetical protein
MTGIKITKRKYAVYLNWYEVNDWQIASRPIIGKWQYIAESSKGKISIVELSDYFNNGKAIWEIYCIEGHIFEKVKRFDSYKSRISSEEIFAQLIQLLF